MEARTVTVMGLRTRVLERDGGRVGDPIVLIHGAGGWAENWRAVIPGLAATGRRVIAVDLPGFGESEGPGQVRYFAPDDAFYPQFVVAVLDELEMDRAHLVGQSLGGSIVLMTAIAAPNRASSLVVVSPGGFGRDIALSLRLCALPGMGLLSRIVRSRSGAYEALRSCYYDTSRITTELYEECDRFGTSSFPEFVRTMAQGLDLGGIKPALREGWIARSSSYQGPVLVIWGREDRVIPVSHLDGVAELLPRAEVHVIDRCGHIAMAERPDEFLRVTLPFLAQAERAVAA